MFSPIDAARRLLRSQRDEPIDGAWLRGLAAVMFLASGVIHVAQIGVHLAEGWPIVGFFLVVGVAQLAAAPVLVVSRIPFWSWVGIAGSGVIIAIWVVSRSIGLPFGDEPGQPEELGVADAGASLLEAITIISLALWLRWRSNPHESSSLAIGIASVALLATAWHGARSVGIFDPDPRATVFVPELADRVTLSLTVGVIVYFALLRLPPAWLRPWRRLLLAAALGTVLLIGGWLAVVTLPAAGGQNADCRYAPVAEVSAVGHAEATGPLPLRAGERRWFPLLVVAACGDEPVSLLGVEPLNLQGAGAQLIEVRLLPVGHRIPTDGTVELPSTGTTVAARPTLDPGAERQLVVLVQGSEAGRYSLDSVTVRYQIGSQVGTFNFATILEVCAPDACPTGEAAPD